MKRMLATAVAVLAILGVAAPLHAGQHRGGASVGQGHVVSRPGGTIGHAVPRAGVPVRPPIAGPYRSYGYRPYYHSRRGLGFYYAYPGHYGFGYSWYGSPYYGYGLGYGYGYGYPGYATLAPSQAYGRVRIQNAPSEAQVFVNGDYVGIAGDFDGARAGLNLEVGAHQIEIRASGFETVVFDVNVQPGQTITYRAHMRAPQE